jgi:hypothetical protein
MRLGENETRLWRQGKDIELTIPKKRVSFKRSNKRVWLKRLKKRPERSGRNLTGTRISRTLREELRLANLLTTGR